MSHYSNVEASQPQTSAPHRIPNNGNRLVPGMKQHMAHEGIAEDGRWHWICSYAGCGWHDNLKRVVVNHYEQQHMHPIGEAPCGVLCGKCDHSSESFQLHQLHNLSHDSSAGDFGCGVCEISWCADEDALRDHQELNCPERSGRRFDQNDRIWEKGTKRFTYLNQRKTSFRRGLSATNEQSVANPASYSRPRTSSQPLLPQSYASNPFQGAPNADSAFANQQGSLPFSYFDFNRQDYPAQQHLSSRSNPAYEWLPILNAEASSGSYGLSGSHENAPFANAYSSPPFVHSAEPPHNHHSALGTATMYHQASRATAVSWANTNQSSTRGRGSSRINRHSARYQPYTLPAHSRAPAHSNVLTSAHPADYLRHAHEIQDPPSSPFDYDNPDVQRSLEKRPLTLRQVMRYGQYCAM